MARYLVCGLGQVGFRVAKLLARLGETVTVITIDARADFQEDLERLGVEIVLGDARSDSHLKEAGLLASDVVIACTDDDLTNLEVALDARHHHPGVRVVARIFDQDLGQNLEESGIVDRALAMSVVAAPHFAASAHGEAPLGEFVCNEEAYRVVAREGAFRVVPAPKPEVVRRHKRVRFVGLGRFWKSSPILLRRLLLGIILLAVLSVWVFHVGMNLSVLDAVYFVVTTLTTTGYGDLTPRGHGPWIQVYGCLMMLLGSAGVAAIYSLITDYVVSERFNQVLGRQAVDDVGHLVVAGLGNVGFRVASHLGMLGWPVVVIDIDANTQYRTFLEHGVRFMAGDARDIVTLQRAGAERARTVLAVTDDDSINLSIAITAKKLNPNTRVVARLFDDRFAAKVQQAMNIDAALSASRIAAPIFVGAAIDEPGLFHFVEGDAFYSVDLDQSDFAIKRRELKPL